MIPIIIIKYCFQIKNKLDQGSASLEQLVYNPTITDIWFKYIDQVLEAWHCKLNQSSNKDIRKGDMSTCYGLLVSYHVMLDKISESIINTYANSPEQIHVIVWNVISVVR
jgi:hypothetical protein